MGLVGAVKRVAVESLTAVLVRGWSLVSPPTVLADRERVAPSDHLQRAMNLIMPLHTPNIVARATLTQLLFRATSEVFAGLDNVGTIHFARFDIVDGNLCMFSVYDGDFAAYIRDFVSSIGDVFDDIVREVKDPPHLPVREHVDEFIEWVRAHDAFQMPESPVDLLTRDIETIPRDTIVALHRNPNVQLGIYRAYPGFSAAQIRDGLSIGW